MTVTDIGVAVVILGTNALVFFGAYRMGQLHERARAMLAVKDAVQAVLQRFDQQRQAHSIRVMLEDIWDEDGNALPCDRNDLC